MASLEYRFGDKKYIDQIFPPAKYANQDLNLHNYADVIAHYTTNSLIADGFPGCDVEVRLHEDHYHVKISGPFSEADLQTFGNRHIQVFDDQHAQKAIRGKELLEELNVWNPMEGYHVNGSPTDGKSKWHLFPPLGLNVSKQKGLLLMHYPPWAIIQGGTFNNAITFTRWMQVLKCAGIPDDQTGYYQTIIDINPIAAPGSGESEYPNDYFPIMMASGFFDSKEPSDKDYIRSMLELYLTPPDWPVENKYTLPLLICGSPLYDPQSPGWFRTTYPDVLPQNDDGVPQVNVLQTGTFKVWPHSKRETPYMIANHMIAAGVTGKCTKNPAVIPDIRQYEAQDLVAATFLKMYGDDPNRDPQDVAKEAFKRWYGNDYWYTEGLYKNGYPKGTPYPASEDDRRTICALAQMDLFFNPDPPSPVYDYKEAWKRCEDATRLDDPCYGNIKPPKGKKSTY